MHHRVIANLSLWILAAAYAGCMTAVAAFQPENIGGETIVLTTTDADGESHERVLSPIDHDGQLFVAANHWPRAWYHRALENPDVSVTRNGETTDYRAVPVSEDERERLLDESGFAGRLLLHRLCAEAVPTAGSALGGPGRARETGSPWTPSTADRSGPVCGCGLEDGRLAA